MIIHVVITVELNWPVTYIVIMEPRNYLYNITVLKDVPEN